MKCSRDYTGMLSAIELILRDIKFDRTSNTFDECLDMLESQIKMIRETWRMEGDIKEQM